jgi:hypothetical protein
VPRLPATHRHRCLTYDEPIVAALTNKGTPRASAYQIQLTRQRIRPDVDLFEARQAVGDVRDDQRGDQRSGGEVGAPR